MPRRRSRVHSSRLTGRRRDESERHDARDPRRPARSNSPMPSTALSRAATSCIAWCAGSSSSAWPVRITPRTARKLRSRARRCTSRRVPAAPVTATSRCRSGAVAARRSAPSPGAMPSVCRRRCARWLCVTLSPPRPRPARSSCSTRPRPAARPASSRSSSRPWVLRTRSSSTASSSKRRLHALPATFRTSTCCRSPASTFMTFCAVRSSC